MKFVWPESIQGLGQQAGRLSFKIELYFCRLGLKYMKSLSEQAGLEIKRICTDFMEKWTGGHSVGDRRQRDRQQDIPPHPPPSTQHQMGVSV